MSERQARVALVGLVALGIIVRLYHLATPGFPTDVGTFMAWAERLADIGPGRFYEPGYFSDYPPGYLYVLWGLGALFDGEALRLAVKAASIPFDVAIALLAAGIALRAGGAQSGLIAAALWLFAPGIVFAGAYWGQVDSVGTLPLMLALIAAGRGRWATAGGLAALAAMIKPQFGVGLIVIAAACAFVAVRERRLMPAAMAGISGLAVVVLLALPFRAGLGDLIALVQNASETYPFTSLYAFNPWSVIADFWQPDEPYFLIGGVLLFAGLVASCVPLWWRRDVAQLLACGALAVMAFYFLPTRAHERYLLPALALLLPFAALRIRVLVPYLALATGFFFTLHFVFSRYDLVSVPDVVAATLYTRPGQIALALLMTGAAAYLAWRLGSGKEPLRADRPAKAVVELAGDPAVASDRGPRWRLPALGPGRPPTRRDVALALLIAVTVLATRGYRLDHPRDMYFDEVYHARTAYELLARREPYEWTHPHLAKQLMALGILAFSGDRVVESEDVVAPPSAFAVSNGGLRAFGHDDGTVRIASGRGHPSAPPDALELARLDGPVRHLGFSGTLLIAVTERTLYEIPSGETDPLTGTFEVGPPRPRALTDVPTALALGSGRYFVGTAKGVEIHAAAAATPPTSIATPAVALSVKPDGSALYVLDPEGRVHVIDPASGNESELYEADGPSQAIAYALSANRLFLARSDEPLLEAISLEGGARETVALANARTGSVSAPATSLAVVPRTQFLYAQAGDRLVIVETHGASPYASVESGGGFIGVDGEGDRIVVAGRAQTTVVATGRQALSWRLPGVIAGAMLAFIVVLLARRLFGWWAVAAIAGALVVLDGSMFAQARIGMNDVYVGLFLIAGWYFVVAAHAPRRSATLDLLIAGALFGLALASKWVAAYALAGLGLLSLVATAYAYSRQTDGGPFDLSRRRWLNAPLLFFCFAVLPACIYLLTYVPWFGGPTIPYGWDLRELTQQMYWYHSGLTSPHPAGSPWWSWPLVLKPVYWYFGQSEAGSAVIYDAGNVAIYWAALAATVWCAIAAVRARSLALGLIVFALAVQLVAWIPITRVLFFYHFFTALPWYLLALAAALAVLWERGRRVLVGGYLVAVLAIFAFFYPFVSGLPVPADQSGAFFILPTWQYDCQFYPAFSCATGGAPVSAPAVLARLAPALIVGAIALGAWSLWRLWPLSGPWVGPASWRRPGRPGS